MPATRTALADPRNPLGDHGLQCIGSQRGAAARLVAGKCTVEWCNASPSDPPPRLHNYNYHNYHSYNYHNYHSYNYHNYHHDFTKTVVLSIFHLFLHGHRYHKM
ncbi:hypothetical protein VOLCADRAFT_100491 [Volvox carteri f. nagariensis]|uniref:Uncharacterized protein n=1 Tax=Volvox carteri f. nagariensis TaxID=3068 RepID=D8UKB5_VOLCA|nr:uncharacterized protein VOLCADRAFT_100491 [Volvox carteri f. nagariensis]EFJ39823.1 hypothetical protein VOLCADRAFT_100491 [Volvox carteri f. nagariensis]|eukprot:XP_002959095.1 hypothetical protein VOLCADRAFT_100491 [Volvox carteri f. nagariensis]